MSEPPSSTGAGDPSLPGSAKTPILSTISGQPASSSAIRPIIQPGADVMPDSPAQNGVQVSASLPSFAAPDACSKRVCTVSSPSIDSGLDSVLVQVPASSTARSPPEFQTKVTPLRQSWPGSQKPEKLAGFGLASFRAIAVSTNSSVVV